MALTVQLRREVEIEMVARAKAKRMPVEAYLEEVIEGLVSPKEYDLDALFALPREEQSKRMREASAIAKSEYDADLALPTDEREMTAFTALDNLDFVDGEH